MFGNIFGNANAGAGRPRARGAFGGNRARNALIAGAGLLALQWWRNRNASRGSGAGAHHPGSAAGEAGGFAAGGTTPGASAF